MRFYEKLNEYIALLGCKAKDVGVASGISAATLSRYRSGERLPDVDSEAFEKLCVAIAEIAKEKNISSWRVHFSSYTSCYLNESRRGIDFFLIGVRNDYLKIFESHPSF